MPYTVEPGKAAWKRKVFFVKLIRQIRSIEKDVNLNRGVAQAQVALLQDKIRSVLDPLGLWADIRHQYQAYAQALDRSQRELKYMVDWIREHQILRLKFEHRGLNPTVLDVLDRNIIYRTRDE